ncbi:RraA family protein [Nitratireductor aquimarinus]|uniref:Putative 4-hydroxy-4-methyl-2-oxoglutarate aldolase n=1 Tax=Nitratireductor aquimarinus TaxID=889300 RepID=A0ABU4AMK3_9HYPH|nr:MULTISPECIES: RraA family protein [Alphaproteobacteria]MBY6022979.1 RraA family protein [Nitratireductor sp. DP7N14-4]MBN7758186.1 RraA family protein [Nitratireductor aquimarinus]MBN7760342.1 RraA family protein [Nitratireductor aquibiodomus]MBN7776216.1 RraA family protein [Nitratireductor pacificus]MBN7779083.1 RraA family protein [Nitratireductor pacificus]
MTIGFCVRKRQRRVEQSTIDAFRELPVANVSDCMSRMYAGGARLRPIHDARSVLAGPALTVRTRPGDNLMLHHALDIAEPGDVIVVDAGGDLTTAILGEIMVAIAKKRGVAGIIVNGAIRDADEIRRMDFPLYAAGVTHRGPYKDGPGEVNTTIAIDGMVIEPGDLVLADGDGVLTVPFDQTETILAATRRKQDAEQVEMAKIADGSVERGWVMESLQSRGCEFE